MVSAGSVYTHVTEIQYNIYTIIMLFYSPTIYGSAYITTVQQPFVQHRGAINAHLAITLLTI